LYINDIDELVNSNILKFADDTKIYSGVNSVQNILGVQTDFNSLILWSKKWQMLFNIHKCKVMHLRCNNCQADYYMDTMQLQKVDEERGRGTIVSNDFKKGKNQCIVTVKQANKVPEMIKRNFVDRSKNTTLALYKSLVGPYLEYCAPI